MTVWLKIVLIVTLAGAVGFCSFSWFVSDIQRVTRFHTSSRSIDCGVVANHSNNGNTAIACAQSARKHGQPFFVVFSGHGVDERISNALVSDSGGKAIELFHGSGMVEPPRNRVMKANCDAPLQLIVESKSPYGFPRLHCAPWPPSQVSRDFLLW